ncbi:unnamed protein product [Medioppia subpectinata]|uniref:Uncharacterized protein n=1 Tax=Medioppia subpectinata TaxID=1979941 RepID=A0A7R9Q033_9ACAR|nr:unnamed protein product [Medioppia subpectinata]CAG2106795.1 unnamed protein product [Medioppia subpectinata]
MRFVYILCPLLALIAIGTGQRVTSSKAKCDNKTISTIDKQVGTLFSINGRAQLPETDRELSKYCTTGALTSESIGAYLKSCAGSFGPVMARELMAGTKKAYKQVCKRGASDSLTRDIMSSNKCWNKAAVKVSPCVQEFVDVLMVLPRVPDRDRMNMGCCHAYKLSTCAQRTLRKTKQCRKEHRQALDNLLANGPMVCGEYFGQNTRCSELIARTPKPDPQSYARPKSLFVPAMQLMDSYRTLRCDAAAHQRMDRLAQRMLTLGTADQIPETGAQLAQWCSVPMREAGFVYGYMESCLSDFAKFLVKLLAGQVAGNFQPYCSAQGVSKFDSKTSDDPMVREYVKAAKCGNKAESKLVECTNHLVDNVMGIVQAPDTQRIRMACCNAYQYRTCILNATLSTRGCSQKTVDWAERAVFENVEPAVNLMCLDHWTSTGKCVQLLANIPRMDPKTYVRPKSVFTPFMKLFDSFPAVDEYSK